MPNATRARRTFVIYSADQEARIPADLRTARVSRSSRSLGSALRGLTEAKHHPFQNGIGAPPDTPRARSSNASIDDNRGQS